MNLVEQNAPPDRAATVIVGGGPGGTGPLVCAAQQGGLGDLLDRGVLVLDRGAALGQGSIGRYVLNADSQGTSFLECLDEAHTREALGIVEISEEARELERYRQTYPPLELVGRHLARIGEGLQGVLDKHPRSAFIPRTIVRRLVVGEDDVVVEALRADEEGHARTVTYRCRSAVLALGGRQRRSDLLAQCLGNGPCLADLPSEKLVLTDDLLTPAGLRAATSRLCDLDHPRAVIIGGSHSAFSAAWALLERTSGLRWARGAISILYRTEPKIFYATAEDARADGYDRFTDQDICPRTRRVHRLGGLRSDGRELWRSITRRPGSRNEDRIELASLAQVGGLRTKLDEADLIVPAFGYRANTVPVVDRSGTGIPLAADNGGALVGDDCRVRREDGTVLPNVFGIGMASGFLPSGPELGGEPSFAGQTNGVWLYQNGIGAQVLEGLEEAP